MKMKNGRNEKLRKSILCKLFGHKYKYHLLNTGRHIRLCIRCDRVQQRLQMAGNEFWTNTVQLTDYGASIHVEGYGEK